MVDRCTRCYFPYSFVLFFLKFSNRNDYSSLCVVSNDMTMIGMWINRANSGRIG